MKYTDKIDIPLICPLHFEKIEENEFYTNQSLYKQAFKVGDVITIQIRFNTGVITYADNLKLRLKDVNNNLIKEQIFLLYELSSIYSYGIASIIVDENMDGCYLAEIYNGLTSTLFADSHYFYITDSNLFTKIAYTHSENDFDVVFDKKYRTLQKIKDGVNIIFNQVGFTTLSVGISSTVLGLYLMFVSDDNSIIEEVAFSGTPITSASLTLSSHNEVKGYILICTKDGSNIADVYYKSNLIEISYIAKLSIKTINDGYFYYRVESGFKPNELSFNIRTSSIGDQNEVDSQTYGMPNETEKFTIGANYGIPNWFMIKINRTFACDTLSINNKGYSKNEGSKIEVVERAIENLEIGFGIYSIDLEKTNYSFLENNEYSDSGIFSNEFDNTFA